ncbi:hypothetical protein NQ318_010913 [Aromia moschata]|uniref:Serpin domain-containing protein n=1 Tax=Aromia moschata TaxID=1265417 RepID=A0AAV8XD65_9CUCU|nr:hypothetical protein NQ318_010913 [Aromia moschata]
MRYLIVLLILTPGVLLAPRQDDDALQDFIESNHKFTSAVYKHCNFSFQFEGLVKEKVGNVIVSPFSTETILALAYEGAKGQTASELLSGLYLPDAEELHAAFKSLTQQFQVSGDDLKLLSANKIYVAQDVEIEENFKDIAVSVYTADVDNVDFSKPGIASEINGWVEENTNNKIQDLIDPNSIGPNTRMVLINTLYFYGKWESMFEKTGTVARVFYRSKNETVDIDTMTQTGFLKYSESADLDAKFLELPYQDGNISMIIALPNNIEGLADLEDRLEEVLEINQFWNEYLEVTMPKFVTVSEIDFVPILKNIKYGLKDFPLGIQRVFEDNADLTGFSSKANDLYISGVTQKAYINITEGGTEAAGGSDIVTENVHSFLRSQMTEEKLAIRVFLRHYWKKGLSARAAAKVICEVEGVIPEPLPGPPGPDPVPFHIDHPFLYVIRKSGVIPFIGRYTGP